MSAIVTGAAGFIGSHLVERLLADGEDVIGVDCLTDYYDPDEKLRHLVGPLGDKRFTFLQRDLATDPLGDVLSDAEVVFHLAGQPGVRSSWGGGFQPYVRNNIAATQFLLEQMRDLPARLVFASSSSVYGDADTYPTSEEVVPKPVSPYGVTKLCSEQLALAYERTLGIDVRCARYFTVYGPRQRPDMAFSKFIAAAMRNQPIDVFGDGEQTRDFTYVSDAVDATIEVARLRNPAERIFNVGGGSRVTVNHLIEILGHIIGREIATREVPTQVGDVRNTGADLTRIASTVGWHPRVPLETGLRAQYEAMTGLDSAGT